MNKQPQNFARLSIGLLTLGIIATMALFFSSCKKKKELQTTTTETYYTVIFNSNGGTAVNPIQIKKGSTITLPASPTKTDFIFGGWFTDDKTFKNQFDVKTPITADLALYAKWDVPEYTVTFDSKGGTEVKPIQVKKGGVITLPASPTKTDFVFGGWYTDKEASVSPFSATTTITADLTLYAKWDEIYYTVTFNSKGGSAVASVQVKKGGFINLPFNPTKLDFVFGGWYTDSQTTTPFVATTPITDNLTLYAKWNDIYYTVTFVSRGGPRLDPIQVKKGNTIDFPPPPTKAGYTFAGWYTDSKTTMPFVVTTPINADLTLYAKWNAVAPAVFTLSSKSFPNGGEIPIRCSFMDMNMSPQLSWANAPVGTKSFLIIAINLSKPETEGLGEGNPLWVLNNIPVSLTSLEESLNGKGIHALIPNLFLEGGCFYWGPDPPKGEKHTYQFTIYALKLADNYFSATNWPPKTKAEAEQKYKNDILGSAFITGTFERK